MKNYLTIFIYAILISNIAPAQDKEIAIQNNENSIGLNVDIVNRYVWRGSLLSANLNIQPSLSFSMGNLSAGFWGSYGVAEPFAEIDIFITYDIGVVSFTLNDYYIQDETGFSQNRYFEWGRKLTPHALEGCVVFNGSESFPLSILATTMFYGNDRDANGDNIFSTYFEANYNKKINDVDVSVFVGGTPFNGMYANRAAIVNLGVGIGKEVKINEYLKVPVYSSIVINPHRQEIFFIVGITI